MIDNKPLFAFAWADRNRRYFVSSCLSLAQGTPFSCVHWRGFVDEEERRSAEHFQVQIPLPKAAKVYFKECGKINKCNCTQSFCRIDTHFCTNKWLTRVNLSLLFMIALDAYLLYKSCRKGGDTSLGPKAFFDELASKMINVRFTGSMEPKGMKTRSNCLKEMT